MAENVNKPIYLSVQQAVQLMMHSIDDFIDWDCADYTEANLNIGTILETIMSNMDMMLDGTIIMSKASVIERTHV